MREYQVIRLIDEGGMGRVYEARADLAFDMSLRVAIKVILGEHDNLAGRQMFANEAMESLRMNHEHPNLVTVFDFGETEEGNPFLVMQYIDGSTGRNLHNRVPFELPAIRRIAYEVSQGLAYLHDRDTLHRNISARNILIGRDGCIKLSDLGLVKRASGSHSQWFMGTPKYGPPEAILDEQTRTKASDMYSLGAVLYDLVIGEAPYGSGYREQVRQRMLDGPDPLERLVDLPEDITQLIAGLIQRDPDARPTVADALQILDRNADAMASAKEIAAMVQERMPEDQPEGKEAATGTVFSVRGAVLRKAAVSPNAAPRKYRALSTRRWPWLSWVAASVVSALVGVAIGVLVTSTALRADGTPAEDASAIGLAGRDGLTAPAANPAVKGDVTVPPRSLLPTSEAPKQTSETSR